MRALFRFVFACVALSVAAPAAAELYKWVDQNGVTNYSNEPPQGLGASYAVGVENRLSVYTPDPVFLQTVKTMRDLTVRTLTMPRPPEPPPYAYTPTQPLTPYEQCLQSGRVGCEDLYGQYYPSWYAAAYPFASGRYPTRFPRSSSPRSIFSPLNSFSQIPNGVQITPQRFSPREAIPRSAQGGGAISHGGRSR
jgi:hypothetical protein